MLNNLLIFICIIFLFIMAVIWMIISSDDRINIKYTNNTFVTAYTILIFYMTFVISPDLFSAKFFANLYFSGTLWIMYFLLKFTRNYTQLEKLDKKIDIFYIILCVIDTFFCVQNIFTEDFFFLSRESFYTFNFYFWHIHAKPLFIFHFINQFVILCNIIFILILAIKKSPSFYKKDYVKFLVAMICLMLLGVVVQQFRLSFDYTVIMFPILADVLFLYPSTDGHKRLINQTIQTSITNSQLAVCCYDENGKTSFINDAACKFFEISIKNSRKPVTFLRNFIENYKLQNKDDFYVEESFFKENKNRIFGISYKKIYQDSVFIGTALTFTDKTDAYKEYKTEKTKANMDPLTGVYNRECFFEIANENLKAEPSAKWIMIATNILNFKIINETQGDEVGDEVIKYCAELISRHAHKNSIFGRISDDHFAILAKEEDFNQKIFLQSIANLSDITNIGGYKLSVLIGLYRTNYAMENAMLMFDKAELAIKNATPETVNQGVFAEYKPEYMEKLLIEKNILSDYSYALRSGEFSVFLQKIVSPDGKLCGAEALVRWIEPGGKIKLPGEFIDILEEMGILHKLDSFVWEEAAKILQKWKTLEDKKDCTINLNISPKDFHYLDIYETFTKLTQKYDISPEKIVLEVKQNVFDSDKEKILETINKLHKKGFIIVLDSYGETNSSLNILQLPAFDAVKIDAAFLKHSIDKEKETIILKNIVQIAKMLNMKVVAEKIETKEQLDLLSDLGITLFQGFYFSKPEAIKDFENN